MSNLITRERAQRNLAQSSFSAAENLLLDALVAAASGHIQRWCRRDFIAQQYDELHDGDEQEILMLRHRPIVSIDRLAGNPSGVLRVRNTSSSNQRTTVKISDTALSLIRVASGTTTVSELTFASNATLAALATAIAALGNGWEASTLSSSYDGRASVDLRPQGAFNAKDAWCELKIHLDELYEYEVDIRRGWLFRGSDVGLRFADYVAGWSGGRDYWRVVYTAGYSTIPEDVQEACAELTASLYWQAKRDPGLVTEAVPGVLSRVTRADLPPTVRTLLTAYRGHEV